MILGAMCALVAAAAAGDGVTTVRFVKRGCYETGIMKYVYGLYPKAWQVAVYGALVIAAEIAAALTVTHYHSSVGYVFVGGGLFQAAMHVYEMVHNELLKC